MRQVPSVLLALSPLEFTSLPLQSASSARLPENSPATKAELKNQRRCELAFEFMPSRHLDMVRWGTPRRPMPNPRSA